jgi:hypothetical protein
MADVWITDGSDGSWIIGNEHFPPFLKLKQHSNNTHGHRILFYRTAGILRRFTALEINLMKASVFEKLPLSVCIITTVVETASTSETSVNFEQTA